MAKRRVQAGRDTEVGGQYYRNMDDDDNGEDENGDYLMHSYWIDVIESCTYKEKRKETTKITMEKRKDERGVDANCCSFLVHCFAM